MVGTVLLIDDNPDMCEVVTVLLEMEGFKVVVAGDSNSALDALSESPPDAILLDHNLPTMSCEAFIPIVRALRPNIPIVLVSGIDGLSERAKELDVDHSLSKPFDSERLVWLLKKIVESKPGFPTTTL